MAVNKKIPQSRLMIQYDTRVEGEPKKKELPYRILAMGDLSQGKSKDAKKSFEDRLVRSLKNGIDATLKDMDITLKLSVPNSINPHKSPTLDIDYKLEKMADFRPDRIAKKVPELNALLQLKDMLSSFEKDLDNNRMLKKTIDQIFSSKEALAQLKTQLPKLQSYQLEKTEAKPLEGEIIEHD
ncbi:type VI secretion system contractile sheath small subunit [Facilibium subflavum]|uniref:type VI secretion system contractile sheath small subunit n=1 Tax=Facilibium subflavum TaxID=2219058 RepID=UPI000E6494B0|nr:type VI secretion system contractile sheath small subunit [Facilibium subflavum]